jgi:hypothetical protein
VSENPKYRSLGNHSEAIQIDYDPDRITYAELLEIFWESHNPVLQAWSQQYKTGVFYHNKEQQRMAEKSKTNLASVTKGKILTELLPFTEFYLAEDYHQKYMLRSNFALLEEFEAKYPRIEELISSTAAARINGYLGGSGTCDQLKSEINDFGLSERGSKSLLEEVCGGNIEFSCPTGNCL